MSLTEREHAVAERIAEREDELISLVSDLIAFDTTARAAPDEAARDERALQEYLAHQLTSAGAECDVWEPRSEDVAGKDRPGRPRLRRPSPACGDLPVRWKRPQPSPQRAHRRGLARATRGLDDRPVRADLRDGLLNGRGACDMKGGIGCMVLATEVLSQVGVRLAGDLVVCTVTDEESMGTGGLDAVAHGVRADAGIVLEPSGHEVCIACRGTVIPTITVVGRTGHAGIPHPHWSEGGPVNAIEKAEIVLDAMRQLQDEWRARPDQRHPLLSPGDIVPCAIAGGEWAVSYPATCAVTYHIGYLPTFADADGWGGRIEREVTEWVHRAPRDDPWLAENLPTIEWAPEVPSAEVAAQAPVVSTLLGAARDAGLATRIAGFDNWHDGATFTRLGGTPCIAFGPHGLEHAHTVDERVSTDSLVGCAQAVAVAAMRFCGVADS